MHPAAIMRQGYALALSKFHFIQGRSLMFFESWVLDWFAILSLSTIGLTLIVYLAERARGR